MNCNTQNAKIKSITEKTLIVGIDVGSETHYARAFDWRNIEFSKKPFAFSNDEAGFASFKAWLEDIKEKFGKTIVLPGMEPTGHYWFNLGAFLQDNGMKPVHVNPHHVHKSKELDDNNPSKDPKTIAALVNEGRFNYPYIPTGVYAEIRSLYGLQVMTQEALIRVKNRIARWLSIYFPEYKDVYRSCDAISGVMVLKVCPLPADAPKYRNHVEEDTITRKEMYDTNLGYIDLLLKATDFKPQRWNDLLSIYDEVDPDIRKKIKEKLLFEIAQMDDDERLIIKNNIRRVVYKHRYFASAEWAMGEDLIGEMLDILDSINFTQQEYDFEYLFRPSYDGIILDPVPYDVDDKRDINESKTKDLLVKKINEFKENNYSLELLSKLCAKEKSSYLGRVLSDYWDDDNFDKNVFASLYKCQSKHEMAIEYIEGLARRGVDVYTNVNELSECVELDDDFRIILFRIEALYTDKKPLVDNASVEIKRAFWKDFRWFSSNNMDWAVAECQQYGTVNSYLDLLYEFHENRNLTPEQLLEKMQRIDVMERGSINSMTDHYLKELLKPLQEQCIEDRDKCAKIAHIEIAFFYLLDWEDMKCFQKEIKHDPEMYAEMVSIIFRHDGDDPEERKTEEFRNYAQVIHRLFDMAKFCPCEENGTVSYDEIKVWVDKLIRILDSNHQKEMFGYVLGRLFAYAPKTADGHYPCEAVCQIIEEYGDESLLSEYRCELFNKREIFSPSAGRAEKDIAEGYKDNAEFLSIKYPKTADVFFKMSQSYVYDSDLERRRAENGYF